MFNKFFFFSIIGFVFSQQCCQEQPYILQTVEEILTAIENGGGGGGGGGITPEQNAYWQNLILSQQAEAFFGQTGGPGGPNISLSNFLERIYTQQASTLLQFTDLKNSNKYWSALQATQMGDSLYSIYNTQNYSISQLTGLSINELQSHRYYLSWLTSQIGYTQWALESGFNKTLAELLSTEVSQSRLQNYFLSWMINQIGSTQFALESGTNKTIGELTSIIASATKTSNYFNSWITTQLGNFLTGVQFTSNTTLWQETADTNVKLDITNTKIDSTNNKLDSILTALGGPPPAPESDGCFQQSFSTNIPETWPDKLTPKNGQFPIRAIGKPIIDANFKLGTITSRFGIGIAGYVYAKLNENFGRRMSCLDGINNCIYEFSSPSTSHNLYVSDAYRNFVRQTITAVMSNPYGGGQNLATLTQYIGTSPAALPSINENNCLPGEVSLYYTFTVISYAPGGATLDNIFEIIIEPIIDVGGIYYTTSEIKIISGEIGDGINARSIDCMGTNIRWEPNQRCIVNLCLQPSQIWSPSTLIKRWLLGNGEALRLSENLATSGDALFPNAGRNYLTTPITSPMIGSLVPSLGAAKYQHGTIASADGHINQLDVMICEESTSKMVARGTVNLKQMSNTALSNLFISKRIGNINYYSEWLDVKWDEEYMQYARENIWPSINFNGLLGPNFYIYTEIDSDGCFGTRAPRIPTSIWNLSLRSIVSQ